MRFFKKTKEHIQHGHRRTFIEPFRLNASDRGEIKYLTGFADLIHQHPYSVEELVERGITQPNRKLYTLVITTLKHGISYLYQIRIAREYFGDDFLHGVSAIYDPSANCIRFINMDDTDEAIQFSREITYFIAKTFYDWMKAYHIYIQWNYETFSFESSTKANNVVYDVDPEARIFWV